MCDETGAKLAFIIFRQRYQELQGVIAIKEGQVSENMVKFVEHLPAETIVLVRATVQDPHSHGQSDIHYTSIHNVEVRVKTVSFRFNIPFIPPSRVFMVSSCAAGYSQSRISWLIWCDCLFGYAFLQIHVVSQVTLSPPFDIHDASRPESDFHVRLHNPLSQAAQH